MFYFVSQITIYTTILFCGLVVNAYIVYGLLRRRSSLNEVRILIVVQSIVAMLISMITIMTFPRLNISGVHVWFYPSIEPPPIIQLLLLITTLTLYSILDFILGIMSVHRVLLFLCGKRIKVFYMIVLPLVLLHVITGDIILLQETTTGK
ncbi:hypothetical protein GCK32_019879, partial [Trichostrongylus colubriformis]